MNTKNRLAFIGEDRLRTISILGILIFGLLVFRQLSPYFFTSSNIFNMLRLDTENGLLAIGMALVIATAGIDLSVGAILGFSGVLLSYSYGHGLSISVSIAIAIFGGLFAGLLNGLIVVVMRLNPLLVTLGTLALFRGLALGISGGAGFSEFPKSFGSFGQSYVGSFPSQFLFYLFLIVIFSILTIWTPWGRRLIAIGINPIATRFAGVNIGGIRLAVYGLSGALAGIASVIYSSRVFSTRGDAGNGLELLAIAAVVVGGASIRGGEISILRTSLAVVALGIIPNGFVLAKIDTSWQYVAIGLVMIVAVVTNEITVFRTPKRALD